MMVLDVVGFPAGTDMLRLRVTRCPRLGDPSGSPPASRVARLRLGLGTLGGHSALLVCFK